MGSLFNELKRRNIFRVAGVYAVVGWLVAQIVALAANSFAAPAWVMQMLIIGLILGFPIALVFAWAFEMTPEGVKRTEAVDQDASITDQTGRKLDFAILGGLALVAGLAIFQITRHNAPATVITEADVSQPALVSSVPETYGVEDEKSIAVLPFVNMSADPDQEYFADGISEEILNALVKATGLRVAGRTSSFSFKGKDATIKEIGETLNVAHVLEGSVRKQNNAVRITAQLIKADDGFHLWSETYDGSLKNIFDLQESISRKVTEELKILLDLNADERLANEMTTSTKAYDLFLRGRELVAKRHHGNLENGMLLMQQAVEEDPEFAEAWAVLAEAEAVSSGYITQTAEQALAANERATRYAKKAIQLDDRLVLPHGVLGLLSLDNDQTLKSIDEYKLALSMEPNNPLILRWFGNSYSVVGRIDLAMPHYEKAFSIDPLSTTDAFNLAVGHFKLGDSEQAIHFFKLSGELRGDVMPVVSFVYDFQGKHEAARSWHRKFLASEYARDEQAARRFWVPKEDFETMIVGAFGGTEEEKAAARQLGTIVRNGPDDDTIWQLEYHIAIGNIDRAFEILDQKPAFFSGFAADFMWLPSKEIKVFRADPRFTQLLAKNKFLEVWQEIGWPDACQPSPGTDGSEGQFSCE